jgi:hypothetical protein
VLLGIFSVVGGLFAGLILGGVKTWWDIRVVYYADKLGQCTSSEQKKAARTRRFLLNQ